MAITNLPVQLTSFIGRERELTEIKRLVSTSRLVTLTGAGGCGKTRLAIQVGSHMSGTFADGVWLVDFVPLREPRLVSQHIVQTFGLRPAPDQPLNESLLNFVRSKQILLILDNCEHLIAACSELAQQLLRVASGLNILATSRQPLAVSGEMIYQVQGLTLPSFDSATTFDPQDLKQYDAVHLFVERARAISPHFTITLDNASAIFEICRRLDGIPLALELASARVNVLTAQQIAARLDNRFALLTSGGRTALVSHHHTLRAAIDWSYDLLTLEEQTLLRRLAVFDAGCTLDIATAVCSEDALPEKQILDLISSLVDKSLVASETVGRAEARYRLLETIREYALEKLKEAGEVSRLRDRHLDVFVARAEEIEPKLNGPYKQLWLTWCDGELDNMRAALAWSLESGHIETGLRLAVALHAFWTSRGSIQECRNWLERLLAQADEQVSFLLRAHAEKYVTLISGFLGDSASTATHARQAVALSEAAGEAGLPVLALALGMTALSAMVEGDHATGYRILERSVKIVRELHDEIELVMGLGTQALAAIALGEYAIARALVEESQSLAHKLGDPYRIAVTFHLLGILEYCEGNYTRAQAAFEQGLPRLRELGATRDEARLLNSLAHLQLHQGDLAKAYTLFCEILSLQKMQSDPQGLAMCLLGFGVMASVGGMAAESARLLAAAQTLGGPTLLSLTPEVHLEFEHALSAVQTQLTEQELEQAQRQGRMLTMEQAIEVALSLPLGPAGSASNTQDKFGGLTEREREIVSLITHGKTNGEIAEQLVLSKRTVEKHVANILSKLELTGRAQIVRWGIEHHLTSTTSS